jgi:hypothetical protein
MPEQLLQELIKVEADWDNDSSKLTVAMFKFKVNGIIELTQEAMFDCNCERELANWRQVEHYAQRLIS